MNKKQNVNVMPGMALFGALAVVGAYASQSSAQEPAQETAQINNPKECEAKTNEVCVNITFYNGCPKVVDNNPDITQSKRIIWQSVANHDPGQPIAEDYEIFFDPFSAGPKIESKGKKGWAKSPVINKKSPAGPKDPAKGKAIGYKYTIVGDNCLDEPLDPRFTVRK
jgi:hypothetical protein